MGPRKEVRVRVSVKEAGGGHSLKHANLVLAGCWAQGRGWLGTHCPIPNALDPTLLRASSNCTAPLRDDR